MDISDIDLPFESRYCRVKGHRMHYFDEGKSRNGRPACVFLHGNPTSSYLWRNYIPPLVQAGYRCVAPDLVGMGLSDKPDIDYDLEEHIAYLDGFIEELELKDIILLGHDWGATIGLDHFRRHPDRAAGIVLMEAMVHPYNAIHRNRLMRFLVYRTVHSPLFTFAVRQFNLFLEGIFFWYGVEQSLSEDVKEAYREPFRNKKNRKPMWTWPRHIPYRGQPEASREIIASTMEYLYRTETPVLLFWGKGGLLMDEADVERLRDEIYDFTDVYLGRIRHYFPEDYHETISHKILQWLEGTFE